MCSSDLAKHKSQRIALGPLSGNPFPDARPAFFTAMAKALSLGLDHEIEVVTPFLTWSKEDVIKRGAELGIRAAESHADCHRGEDPERKEAVDDGKAPEDRRVEGRGRGHEISVSEGVETCAAAA